MPIYYDLNIPETCKPKDILRYVRCGYTRLAINRVVNVADFGLNETDSKKLSKENKSNLRSKFETRLKQSDWSNLIDTEVEEAAARLNTDVKIFSRITIVASDLNQLTNFLREFSVSIKNYEIVAIEARSADVLAFAANSAPVEMVAIDARGPIALNRSVLKRCRERSVSLEIDLGPALASAEGRAHTARLVSELGLLRCPPILTASSGAPSSILIRNRIGIACLLASLGLADKLIRSIHDNARMVVQRGLARKHTVHGSAAIVALARLPGCLSVTALPPATGSTNKASDSGDRPPAHKKQKTHNN